MSRAIHRRLLALETSIMPTVASISYYFEADGIRWQNSGGLCTPCPMTDCDAWEKLAVKQQAALIASCK